MAVERGQHLLTGDAGGSHYCNWNLHRIKFRPLMRPFGSSIVRRFASRAYRRHVAASI
jgi:hypothetical protein